MKGSKATVEHTGWAYKPEGMTSAQLNLPYCVATLLLEGDVFVDQFRDDMIADPARMALAAKVEVIEDPKITALGSKFRHKVSVAVHLKDGAVLEETVEAPRGSEQKFCHRGRHPGQIRQADAAGAAASADRPDHGTGARS